MANLLGGLSKLLGTAVGGVEHGVSNLVNNVQHPMNVVNAAQGNPLSQLAGNVYHAVSPVAQNSDQNTGAPRPGVHFQLPPLIHPVNQNYYGRPQPVPMPTIDVPDYFTTRRPITPAPWGVDQPRPTPTFARQQPFLIPTATPPIPPRFLT